MSQTSGIEWTDATWNPVGGCSIASPGCTNCYAQRMAGTRLSGHPLYKGTTSPSAAGPVFNGHLTLADDDAKVWDWPGSWKGSKTPRLGIREDFEPRPSLIFVGDMSDVFHEARPERDIWKVNETILRVADVGRQHIFQMLTKRPERMAQFYRKNPVPARAWFGFSAERQNEFDERWPHMRELAARGFTVFVSYEPALGPLTLPDDFLELGKKAWLIAGGESGRAARECRIENIRDVVAQCQRRVPCFVKQLGARPTFEDKPYEALLDRAKGGDMDDWPRDLRVRQFPEVA